MLARRPLLLLVFSPCLTDSAGGFVEILPMSQSGVSWLIYVLGRCGLWRSLAAPTERGLADQLKEEARINSAAGPTVSAERQLR